MFESFFIAFVMAILVISEIKKYELSFYFWFSGFCFFASKIIILLIYDVITYKSNDPNILLYVDIIYYIGSFKLFCILIFLSTIFRYFNLWLNNLFYQQSIKKYSYLKERKHFIVFNSKKEVN